jgi:hypothetical protein
MPETKVVELQSTVQRNPDMIFTDFGAEMVMLSMEDSRYYGINEVGVRVWELIETPTPIAGIIDVICDEFDVSTERCEQDVLAFVSQLQQKNMAIVC